MKPASRYRPPAQTIEAKRSLDRRMGVVSTDTPLVEWRGRRLVFHPGTREQATRHLAQMAARKVPAMTATQRRLASRMGVRDDLPRIYRQGGKAVFRTMTPDEAKRFLAKRGL